MKTNRKKFITNKTHLYHIETIWSFDILDLKDYGSENKRRYRYVLVVIDNLSNIGWTKPFIEKL